MRNALRMFVVGFLVMAMSFNPASACQFCSGYWDDGYYSDGGDCCYETVVYDGCGDCEACGGCESCDGVVIEAAPAVPAESNPTPKAKPAPQQPAEVERPIEATPAPLIPPQPAPVEPAPVEPAQPAEPDNLFNGTEETTTPPPTETPAETPAEEPNDLFGTPSEPVETTPPAETPAEQPDDLFSAPPATEPAEEMPAESEEQPATPPAEEETPAEEKDDIFGASRDVLREAGGLASEDMRLWTDDTGNFSCRGRLVRFIDGQVRLLKDNGRMTTVPLSRLSAGDLQFVNRQAGAQRTEAFQTAQSQSATPLLAN